MTLHLLKKTGKFVVAFMLITFAAFFISVQMPGDVLDHILLKEENISGNSVNYFKQKEKLAHRLGMDKPLFYFSVSNLAEANSYRYFSDKRKKIFFTNLLNTNGNYKKVFAFTSQLDVMEQGLVHLQQHNNLPAGLKNSVDSCLQLLDLIIQEKETIQMENYLTIFSNKVNRLIPMNNSTNTLVEKWNLLIQNQQPWKKYIPVINFYSNNRFHNWLFGTAEMGGILTGNMGTSLYTGKKITTLIAEKIGVSLCFALASLLLAFGIGIPLASWMVYKNNKLLFTINDFITSIFYSTPTYIAGVLLLFTLSNPDYLNVLPSGGLKPFEGFQESTSMLQRLWLSLPYIVLPLFCYTYSIFAFIMRTTNSLLQEELKKPYVLTARAKGVTPLNIITRHALKNIWPALISIFSIIFPVTIGGSVLIESLFSLPGMGAEIVNAALMRNYPFLAAVILIIGFISLILFSLSDWAIAKIDPRFLTKRK